MGKVVSVNISEEKGTPKKPVGAIEIDGKGVVGDAHAGSPRRQVSLLAREDIDVFASTMGREIADGEFAENITTSGVDLAGAGPMDRISIGSVELEVTQIGKECHGDGCAIFRELGKCVMPKNGIFCRVLQGGKVAPGDEIHLKPRPLKCLVITASDRASKGEYEDRSGPEVESLLATCLGEKHWHAAIMRVLLPDDRSEMVREMTAFEKEGGDIVIITGGTGIGPHDVTPEAVMDIADKTLPGIMEAIRVKYGADKPGALLSRSVAAVKGRMLIYAIPGSVKAVREYMQEILKTVEHAIFMLHEVEAH